MTDFFRRHSLLMTSALLLAASFQLMSLSIADRTFPQLGNQTLGLLTHPFEKMVYETQQTVRHVWDRYIWLLAVQEEQEELQKRIKALEAQNSMLIEFESENKRLRGLLNFTQTSGYSGVTGKVIARDPSNWIKTITVDRGYYDGVAVGMAVVDGHAIVGQTIAVSPRSAKVLLLTDHSSAIDSIVQSSRASGIVEGSLEQGLRMLYVDKDQVVKLGDRIIASGLDEIFPKGVLVGVVTMVQPREGGLFQTVEIHPSANLDRLENVMILVPSSQENSDTEVQ